MEICEICTSTIMDLRDGLKVHEVTLSALLLCTPCRRTHCRSKISISQRWIKISERPLSVASCDLVMIRCDTRLDSPERVIKINFPIFNENSFEARVLCDLRRRLPDQERRYGRWDEESNTSYMEVMIVCAVGLPRQVIRLVC